MKKRRKPELLVPAGSMEPLIAAVENGADAVYVGGRLFNARMNAGNFDDERMLQALDYAHARGVKVFVTMNTLIFDEEMEEAVEYAGFLYRAGVDALIVQDLGLGRRIHEELPDFPLHLSTQGTACDGEAVALAKELGYERVVLSRELSLAEMEAACRDGGLDIEVFVHGALCICYSGQCQMSRFYGGRSGNRGACAQPCRLPYEGVDENGKEFEQRIYINDVNPSNATVVEMRALEAHYKVEKQGGFTSLPLEAGNMGLNDRRDFIAMFKKSIEDLNKLGRFDLSLLWTKSMDTYLDLTSANSKYK